MPLCRQLTTQHSRTGSGRKPEWHGMVVEAWLLKLRRSDSVERQSLELNPDGMAAQADSSQIAATLARTDSIQRQSVKPRERKRNWKKEKRQQNKKTKQQQQQPQNRLLWDFISPNSVQRPTAWQSERKPIYDTFRASYLHHHPLLLVCQLPPLACVCFIFIKVDNVL